MSLAFIPMAPWHGVAIRRQASQTMQFGLSAALDLEEAELLADGLEAWTAMDRERIVAIFGMAAQFAACHATCWATLSDDVGVHHLAITRFIAERIANHPADRLEAIVECRDMEVIIDAISGLDPWELATIALEQPTPGMRWARAVGFRPAAVLRKYGAEGRTHMLYERIRAGRG